MNIYLHGKRAFITAGGAGIRRQPHWRCGNLAHKHLPVILIEKHYQRSIVTSKVTVVMLQTQKNRMLFLMTLFRMASKHSIRKVN